ncbi:MAG: dTDP-glucose 4,6-dehydratase [Opitutales bacterium]|nr:dTDP-glucose 4,6-dehydratase [Opitutales bacterium]
MKLLVTGGAGFIGSNFVRHLLRSLPSDSISRLVNLDKLTYAGNPDNLRDLENDPRYVFVHGDIGDADTCTRLFQEHAFDAVVNFAAESHVDRSIDSPEPFFETNVVGTLRLVNTALKYWKGLEDTTKPGFRFLHVSTDEVYGSLSPQDPAFQETTPFAPNSPYSASKAASDHIIRAYHHTYGLPVITTNCSNNYGPYQFPEKLIPLMILNALEGKSLPIYGDGMNIRDWLYVDDHCSGIWTALNKGTPGETYNIGGKNEQPNIAIVDTICDLLDKKQPRQDGQSYQSQKIYVKDRPGHDRRYAINCSKIESELGWAPAETFATGIEKTVDWYLANREWCRSISEGKYRRERLGNA